MSRTFRKGPKEGFMKLKRLKGPDVTFQFVKGVSGPPLPDVGREMRQTLQDERIRRQRMAQIRQASNKEKSGR